MNQLDDGQSTGKQPPKSTEDALGERRAHDKTAHAPRAGQRILNLQEAAAYLGCCERTVRNLILDGVIPHVALTSRIQIDIVDLDNLIESRKKIYE